jgi:uncharacterized membrane protein YphA (DoxX/SURF4 family)
LLSATAPPIGYSTPSSPAWRGNALGLLRIAFGLVWAVDAWFKWQPAFVNGFAGYLTGAKSGQPRIVKDWIGFWVDVVKVNPSLFAHLLAVAETAVALGLILGLFSNAAYLGGGLLAVMIWSTAEGFGGPYKAGSTDIGAAIIYVLVFAGLYLAGAGRHLSLDARLRRTKPRPAAAI